MPICTLYLVEGRHHDGDVANLLREISTFHVHTLYPELSPPPIERVRALVVTSKPQHWATAGTLVAEGGADAPYFTCLALAGRPSEQLHALLRGLTDLIVKHLGVRRESVRGQVQQLDPSDWSIGGEPANVVRSNEVAERTWRDACDGANDTVVQMEERT